MSFVDEIFNDIFDGNVTISFKDIDEESVLLKVKVLQDLFHHQISCMKNISLILRKVEE